MLNFSSSSDIYAQEIPGDAPAYNQTTWQSSLQSSYLSPDRNPPTPLTSIPILQSSLEQLLNARTLAQASATPSSADLNSAISSRSESTPYPVSSCEIGSAKSSRMSTRGRAMLSRPSSKRPADEVVLRRADVTDTGIVSICTWVMSCLLMIEGKVPV